MDMAIIAGPGPEAPSWVSAIIASQGIERWLFRMIQATQ